MDDIIEKGQSSKIIALADRAPEVLNITELTPANGKFIGKQINRDGSIEPYPTIKWWRQDVAHVPIGVSHLFAYLKEARTRNICLIRGAPANLERQPTRRLNAFEIKNGKDRGDHGFIDEPTKLIFPDLDGFDMEWRDDPERALRSIVFQMGEPWASTSFVWYFSAGHGLEIDKHGRWTGQISDGNIRVHFAFIADRALDEGEATALIKIAKAKVPKLDKVLAQVVQPNYIKRPLWLKHPERDPLGDISTIGWIKGEKEFLAVPDNLAHKARWAKAQGHNVDIADHPDARTAVRAAGGDNEVRSHLKSAVVHLLNANPVSEVASFADHAIAIVKQLQNMLELHRDEILANLAPYGRGWSDVLKYLPDNMIDWARWVLDHPSVLERKTIKLVKDKKPQPQQKDEAVTLEAICARVARAMERVRKGEAPDPNADPFSIFGRFARGDFDFGRAPLVELIAAPTGSRKSTRMRAEAVTYVTEHPDKSVVILMPRHKLGDEQIELLHKEHPDADFSAAVWRGRQAWDPEFGDGHKIIRMCQRADEAKELEDALLSVDRSLCKQGRGKKAIKCPLFDVCGYQRQKRTKANIWFAAHEMMTHEKPEQFGDIGTLMVDESPLDAYMFGIDSNDMCELPLDKLREPAADGDLKRGRKDLYRLFDKVKLSDHGVPLSLKSLDEFGFKNEETTEKMKHNNMWPITIRDKKSGRLLYYSYPRKHDPRGLASLEWRGKVEPKIRPNMTRAQVRKELEKAADNGEVKARATLWELIDGAIKDEIELCGRIQLHRSKTGRVISMVGLRRLAKGWQVQTLIADATGDVELLRAIWPQLDVEEEPWPQLPRPDSVRVFQIVDRSISKWAVAVEGKSKKELERKAAAARRMYAAVLLKALEYGGAEVAVIVYKSSEEWIRKNCFVPDWLKLSHHGDVTGTNAFKDVAALFEVGRMQPPPEAVVRQGEALFSEFVPQREYHKAKGRIPIISDEAGNNYAEVELYQHRNPMVRRLLWQAREGTIIQTGGRARAGLRDASTPLHIHRWTDVPVPELGPVEPVLWEEVDAGLDGLMLATGGVWLECIPDAVRAYPDLFTVNGLKTARRGGEGVSLIGILISKTPSPRPISYQRAVKGSRSVRAVTLLDFEATRAWLETKLGPLARFEAVDPAQEEKGRAG